VKDGTVNGQLFAESTVGHFARTQWRS